MFVAFNMKPNIDITYNNYMDIRYEHAQDRIVQRLMYKKKPAQCDLDLFRCSSGSLTLPFTVCRWQRRTYICLLAITAQLITEQS